MSNQYDADLVAQVDEQCEGEKGYKKGLFSIYTSCSSYYLILPCLIPIL